MKKIILSLSRIIKAIERARNVILILLMAVLTAVMYYLEKLYIGAPVLEDYALHLTVGCCFFLAGVWWNAIYIGKMRNIIGSISGGLVVLMFMAVGIHAVHFLPLFLELELSKSSYIFLTMLGVVYIPLIICISLYVFFNYCCGIGKYVEQYLKD